MGLFSSTQVLPLQPYEVPVLLCAFREGRADDLACFAVAAVCPVSLVQSGNTDSDHS